MLSPLLRERKKGVNACRNQDKDETLTIIHCPEERVPHLMERNAQNRSRLTCIVKISQMKTVVWKLCVFSSGFFSIMLHFDNNAIHLFIR